MYTKVKMLLWERWRRTFLGLAIVSTLLILGLLVVLFKNQPVETALVQLKACLFFGSFYLSFILLLNIIEGMNIDLAFPKRLFNFPVSTFILTSTYFLYGIVIISVPFFIILMFQKLFFVSTSIGWSTLLQIETVYIGLQALCWIGGPARYLYVVFSSAAIYIIFKIADSFNLIMGTNILFTLVIIFSIITSFWSVSEYRKGNWLDSYKWMTFFFDLFRKRQPKHFSSAFQAQVWFELRQTGHLFTVASLIFVFFGLATDIYVAIISYKYNNQLVSVSGSISYIFMFTIASAFIAGLLSIGVYHRDHASGASKFWLRRPMATQTLSVARLKAAFLSITRVFIMLWVIVLLAAAYDWTIGKLDLRISTPIKWIIFENSKYEIIAMTVLGMLGYFLFYWVSLRMPSILFVLGYLLVLPFAGFGGDARAMLIIDLFTIALPVFVIAGFCIVIKRKLINKTTLLVSVCVFPLIFLALIPYPWLYAFDSAFTGIPDFNIITASRLFCLSTLPLITIFTTPLVMQKMRHR